ncbi:unnamed protein product [Tenebrio molitor]|nr:unnamed protein product [Tenebrio molitor]
MSWGFQTMENNNRDEFWVFKCRTVDFSGLHNLHYKVSGEAG